MPNIRNRGVVVLTPEEGHVSKRRSDAQHRTRNRLSLTFRRNPVLNPHAFAGNWVRIACDITRRIDVRSARAQSLVHNDTVIDGEARVFGQRCSRRYTNP